MISSEPFTKKHKSQNDFFLGTSVELTAKCSTLPRIVVMYHKRDITLDSVLQRLTIMLT